MPVVAVAVRFGRPFNCRFPGTIGVPELDPIAIGAAVFVLIVCAGLALLVPIRRATRVDPITVRR